MFENIGKKIKGLASVICYIQIVAYIVIAIINFAQSDGYDGKFNLLLGWIFLVLGPLIAWLGSIFTYGFGELIDRTASIDNKISTVNDKKNANTHSAKQNDHQSTQERRDPLAELRLLRLQGKISEEEFQAIYSQRFSKK